MQLQKAMSLVTYLFCLAFFLHACLRRKRETKNLVSHHELTTTRVVTTQWWWSGKLDFLHHTLVGRLSVCGIWKVSVASILVVSECRRCSPPRRHRCSLLWCAQLSVFPALCFFSPIFSFYLHHPLLTFCAITLFFALSVRVSVAVVPFINIIAKHFIFLFPLLFPISRYVHLYWLQEIKFDLNSKSKFFLIY